MPSGIIEVCLTVLRDNITVGVISHTVYNMTVKTLCEKLSESIVGVLGNIGDRLVISSLIRLGYRGDSFLGIILIREHSTIGEKDLAHELSCGRRLNLYVLYYIIFIPESQEKLRTSYECFYFLKVLHLIV